MRRFAIGLVLGVFASLFFVSTALAGACDPITEHGKAIQQEFQKWTEQAYSDGVITGEEAEQSQVFSDEISRITEELGNASAGAGRSRAASNSPAKPSGPLAATA